MTRPALETSPARAVRLTLICHGATSATRAGAFPTGIEPLEARAQADSRAAGPLGRSGDRAVASPTTAAAETAALLGLSAGPEPALRDLDVGLWAGLALETVAAREPDALAFWLTDPAAAPHGGESVVALLERVGRWLDGLAAEPGPSRVIAVTHAAVIRAAVVHALGAPATAWARLDVPPLGRAVLSRSGPAWRLQRFDILSARGRDAQARDAT